MLFCLLSSVVFGSRKLPAVDWIRGKIGIIINRTMCMPFKSYIHVSKSYAKQCLEAVLFMSINSVLIIRLTFG